MSQVEFGDGLGQFLQPAEIGEAAVVNRGVWTEDDFQLAFQLVFVRRRGQRRAVNGGRLSGQRRAGYHAIVYRAPPPGFEIAALVLRRPIAFDDVVSARFRRVEEHLQHLVSGAAVVERLDERLLDGDRAIESARVAPAFQIVRLRQMPLADLGGLVLVEAQVRADACFLESIRQAQFHRRVEDRVSSQNQQQVHGARIQIADQVLERSHMVHRAGFDGIGIEDRFPHVAEFCVHHVGQGVNDGRLELARHHQAGALVAHQVLNQASHPFIDVAVLALLGTLGNAQTGGQQPGEFFHVAGAQGQAVIGLAAGGRGHRLHRVEPVHRGVAALHTPPRRELARVAQAGLAGCQEIRIQRDDHVGVRYVVVGVDGLAERQHSRGARAVRPGRLPLVPLGGGKQLPDRRELIRHRRRGHGFGEDADARPAARTLLRHEAAQHSQEIRPGPDLAAFICRAAAVRIVELQHRGLAERIESAQRGRVFRIAFHLGGPAFVALHQNAVGDAAQGGCRGVEQRLAGNQILRLPHIGHDVLGGLAGASGQPGQGQRGAHHLQEVAAPVDLVFIVGPANRLARKFALQQILEFGRRGQVFQVAPELAPALPLQTRSRAGQIQVFR